MNSESRSIVPAERISSAKPLKMHSREYRVMLYGLSLGLDSCAILGGLSIASLFQDEQWLSSGSLSLVSLALPVFLMFSIAREAQCVETLEDRSLGIRRALSALLAMALSLMIFTFVLKLEDVSRLGFALAFVASAGLLIVSRMFLNVVFWKMFDGRAIARLLILDGVSAIPEPGMDVIDLGQEGLWPDVSRPEMLDALSKLVAEYDRIVVACTDDHRRAWSLFLRGSEIGGEIVLQDDILDGAVAIGRCGESDTLILSLGPLSLFNRMQKRTFDLLVSVPLLIVLSPLLLVVAIAIKLESRGDVFFRQTRVGHGNRQFTILKFRSMREEAADQKGCVSTSRDDDRITRIGRLIRSTSIDELPQLVNVLKGDMSLVGPRPHALGSLAGDALFWEVTEQYWLRHALKPGITGLAQVRGLRGATAKTEDLTLRLSCDLEYASQWSVANDIVILLKTLRVLMHRNAF